MTRSYSIRSVDCAFSSVASLAGVFLGDVSFTDVIWLFVTNPVLPQVWRIISTCPAPWGFSTSPIMILMSRHNHSQLLRATSHNRSQLLRDCGCYNRGQTYSGVCTSATKHHNSHIACCGKAIFVLQPKTCHPRWMLH